MGDNSPVSLPIFGGERIQAMIFKIYRQDSNSFVDASASCIIYSFECKITKQTAYGQI
jgi:hypothetical protein